MDLVSRRRTEQLAYKQLVTGDLKSGTSMQDKSAAV